MIDIRAGLFTFSLCIFGSPAWSADFYVSPRIGNDSYDGRSAAVIKGSGPFATLQALQRRLWAAGDRIHLRCGERFYGPVSLLLKGNAGPELIISSYGDDCPATGRPIVDGRMALNHGQLGKGAVNFEVERQVAMVFDGDQPLTEARFPQSAWLLLTSENAVADLKSAAPAHSELAGAVLHARTQEWFIESSVLDGESGRLVSPLKYPLRRGVGVYLTGRPWIGQLMPSSWTYDSMEGRLHIQTPRKSGFTHVVAGDLFKVSGRGSVSISGIRLFGAGGAGLVTSVSGQVRIANVSVEYASGNGVSVLGASHAVISNSNISATGLDGIFFAETAYAEAVDNSVNKSGMLGHPRAALAAINAHRTQSAHIFRNEVADSAYHGIRISGDARVLRNTIARSCKYLSDCGAIYTWRRGPQDVRPSSEIAFNLIDGVNGDASVKFGVNDWFAGIYLDEFTSAVRVHNNIIVGANQGVYLHNAFSNTVENNWIVSKQLAIVEKTDAGVKLPGLPNALGANWSRLGLFDSKFSRVSGSALPTGSSSLTVTKVGVKLMPACSDEILKISQVWSESPFALKSLKFCE